MMGNLGCLRGGDVIASASDIDELLRYRDLKEQGRMVILPDGMNLRKLLDILTEYSPGCPEPEPCGWYENFSKQCNESDIRSRYSKYSEYFLEVNKND